MLTLDVALAFFGIAVALALAPGPDNLFVLTQSARSGLRAGLAVIAGLCTGVLGHTLAVAAGLATLLAASATAFTVLKVAGAIYLAYLGWQAWRAPATAPDGAALPAIAHGALYRRGVLMSLTNPKVSLFFLAFLPQFASPERGSVALQILQLGGLFILAAALVFTGIALGAARLGQHLARSPRLSRGLNRITGVLFIGLALRLVTAQR